MAERWFYQHAGQTRGPETAEQLRLLAAAGELAVSDPVWPEGQDSARAVPAQSAIEFPPPSAPADDLDEEFLSFAWDTDAATQDASLVKERPEAAPEPCRLVLGSASSRGRVRDRNEDSLLVQHCAWSNLDQRHDVAFVVIADGMGGHQAGDRASGLVLRAMAGVLPPLLSAALRGEDPEPVALAEALDAGLQEANRVVQQAAKDDPACKDMGSTAVALLLWDGQAIISLVGDCRVYHWRGGLLTQVTRDQTLVTRMVELGQLTPQEAARHPRRSEVTQAVGKYGRLSPARSEVSLEAGDWLVACCDGLYAHVDERMLAEAIGQAGTSATGLANRLVELANQGGGSDNCTVIAVLHR